MFSSKGKYANGYRALWLLLRATSAVRSGQGRCQKSLPHVPDRKHQHCREKWQKILVAFYSFLGAQRPSHGNPFCQSGQTLGQWRVFLSHAPFYCCAPGQPGDTAGNPWSGKPAPLLHVRAILTSVIDAYLCRGSVLESKRQTFLAKHNFITPTLPGAPSPLAGPPYQSPR